MNNSWYERMKRILNTLQKMEIQTAIILIAVSFGLILFGFYMVTHSLFAIVRPPPPSAPLVAQEAYWKERIHTVGGSRAYEELVTSVRGLDFAMQHSEAHIFGDALYTEVGLDGMSVCDWRLHGGCWHQFMGRAVTDHGTASIAALDQSCKGNISCQHGIGHGIVSALGYTFSDLQKSLALCHTLADDTPIFGCTGGVPMEYNLRHLLGDASFNARPLGTDWLDPCDRLSGDDARACYFWQPTWWVVFIPTDQESAFEPTFKHMGDLCRSISDKTFMYACIAGTGHGAMLETSAEEAPHLCDVMYPDASESLLCKFNVAVTLKKMLIQDPDTACDGLPEEARAYCRDYVGENSQRILPLPMSLPQQTS